MTKYDVFWELLNAHKTSQIEEVEDWSTGDVQHDQAALVAIENEFLNYINKYLAAT